MLAGDGLQRRDQSGLIHVRAMLAHTGAGSLHQVLADMQLTRQAGAQRIAQLIEPFGRSEGCGAALVTGGVRLGQQFGHRDGIGLALPDARSARHGIMQTGRRRWAAR